MGIGDWQDGGTVAMSRTGHCKRGGKQLWSTLCILSSSHGEETGVQASSDKVIHVLCPSHTQTFVVMVGCACPPQPSLEVTALPSPSYLHVSLPTATAGNDHSRVCVDR